MERRRRGTPPPGAGARLGPGLAAALRTRWRRYLRELRRCQAEFSEESVHDLRVAIRRLVAALDVAAVLVPADGTARLRRRVKKLLKAFGPLRDTQVHILSVRERAGAHPGLASLLTVLLLREQRLTAKLAERVRGVHEEGHGADIEAAARAVTARWARPASARAAHAMAIAAGAAAFAQASLLREGLDRTRPESLHRLRIAFKKLRYTIEMLAPALPWVTRDLLARMNAFQTALGEIQDGDVLDATVRAFARRAPADTDLSPVLRALAQEQRARVRAFLARADELYVFWPIPPGAPRDLRGASVYRRTTPA